MPSVWFVMPVSGRLQLAAICMKQLKRTCVALSEEGIEATCVVIGDDANLATARDLGFGTVTRNNSFTSRKFNDGVQLALDPRYNPRPADYVVPIGSDDWVDHRLFLDLPSADTMVGFRNIAFVREDGQEITIAYLDNEGGSGIRIYPRALMAPLGYRPADEDRSRGCDTSILVNLMRCWNDNREMRRARERGDLHEYEVNQTGKMVIEHRHLHDRQIVDWKTGGGNLNSYDEIARRRKRQVGGDPFVELAGVYPDVALEEMAAHYGRVREAVAA